MTMNMEQLIDFFPQTFGTEAFCLSGSFHFFVPVPKLFNENVSSRVLTFLGLVRGEFNHGFLGFCPEGSKLKDRGTKEQSWDSWTSSSLSSLAALFPSLFISRYTGCSNRTCVPHLEHLEQDREGTISIPNVDSGRIGTLPNGSKGSMQDGTSRSVPLFHCSRTLFHGVRGTQTRRVG